MGERGKWMNTCNLQGIGMTSQRTRERLVNRLREEGVRNLAVLKVISDTPRHIFVDEALASRAYEDTALPIGYRQTISRPYTVARMTEILLEHGKLERVLEIGTGSGYQTAVLAQLVPEVFTVERIEGLLRQARSRFMQLGLRNIRAKYDDGNLGWPEKAPYDGIIATAAPSEIPDSLLMQLAPGGRLIIPVGAQGNEQSLQLITREHDGFVQEAVEAASFVPMLGGQG